MPMSKSVRGRRPDIWMMDVELFGQDRTGTTIRTVNARSRAV
jgi:hypothetical protein